MANRPYNYDRYDRDYEQEDRERDRGNRDLLGRDWMTNEPRYGQRGREGDYYRGRQFGGGYSNEFGSGLARDFREGRERWNQNREDWGRNREYGREYGRESWDRPFESGRTSNLGDYDRNRQYGWEFDRNRGFGEDRPRFGQDYDEGPGLFDRERGSWRGREYGPGSGRFFGRESSGYGQGREQSRWGSGGRFGQGVGDFGQRYGSIFRNDYEDYGSFDRERGRRDFSRDRGEREESIGESIKNFFGIGPKGWKRSDDRIRDEISERLEEHPRIDASEIEVIVKEGEVTLTGSVDNREAKRLAEDLAENARGVKDVHNQIRVVLVGTTGTIGGTGTSVTGHRPPASAGKDKDKERAA